MLILGSFPGTKSLKDDEYYAKKKLIREIMGHVLCYKPESSQSPGDSNLSDMPYPERLDFLKEHGIAIWDVLESCSRKRSLDSSICNGNYNDIQGLLKDNPSIGCIALNGKSTVKKLVDKYKKELSEAEKIEFNNRVTIPLLSTSPTNTRYTKSEKVDDWEKIKEFCNI